MKRWILPVAILAIGAVEIARADYVIIIANLGLSKDQTLQPGDGQPIDGGGGLPEGGGFRPLPLRPAPAVGGPFPGGEGVGGQVPAPVQSHLLVTAIVAMDKIIPQQFPPPYKIYQVKHRWGMSYFQQSDNVKMVPWTTADGRPVKALSLKYQEKQNEIAKGGKPTADRWVELAEWALSHGQVEEVAKNMEKAAAIDKDHPTVAAFRQVEEALKRPITRKDAADDWKRNLLENYQIERSDHYALLHTAPDGNNPEVRSRLDRLEQAYRGFYYWFALKRKPLPVPDHRLVAVLVSKEDDFWRQHEIFDRPTCVADGFYAPRDNLAVFSTSSLSLAHRAMLGSSKELWTTYDRDLVLMGKAQMPQPRSPEDVKKNFEQFWEASTKALFLKVMEIDSERATVSHDGTRQLVAAAGLLPRTVATPEWVQFGIGSFFETAKGSPWGGIGVPSLTFNEDYNYLFQYKKMASQDRKLDKAALLKSVVTDQLFRQAVATKDGATLLKARSTAWALTFFLAHKRLDELLTYYKELAKLPRDLEFDDEVLLGCFVRAFKLTDSKGQPDPRKMDSFARECHDYINLTPFEADEMLKQIQKTHAELKAGPKPGSGQPPVIQP